MEMLKERILNEGKIVNSDVIQVSSFLNHMIDTKLLYEIGKEFARVFFDCQPTKIITIESSGIPIAAFCALELQIPFIIAKKHSAINLTGDFFNAEVFSYTKQTVFNIRISKEFINQGDRILIIDDFLACGGAVEGLMHIINEANATLIGVGICIEKSFLQGASKIISQGVNLHSLVRIKSIEDGNINIYG
jgi:xanthine phosphoribosyltransferase